MFAAAAILAPLAGEAAAGTIEHFKYTSPALGRDQVAEVYLPDSDPPDDGWPVLYLLHGLHGRPSDWDTLGRIRATLDKMIEAKQIKPMVVVMPDGGDNSWYVDSADVGGPGNYASAVGHDLQAAIEEHYDVGADRLHRAIAGISMGGYGALRLSMVAPDRYGAVAAMSPAIWQNIPSSDLSGSGWAPPQSRTQTYFQKADAETVTIGVDLPPPGEHFDRAYGTPFDPKRFNDANVFTLLQKDLEQKKRLPPMFLTVGDDDSHLLWRGAIAFFETMQMNKLWVDFRMTNGDHNWALWRSSLVDVLVFVDAKLNKLPTH